MFGCFYLQGEKKGASSSITGLIFAAYPLVVFLLSPIIGKFVSKALLFNITASKVSKYGDFSGTYFPAFGWNTEIYGVNLRIQSQYRKIRTRKNSVFGDTFHAVI